MVLAFIGEFGWDIYVDNSEKLWAVPKEPGRKGSFFGDKYHIKRLMANGHFNERVITDKGLEVLSGLHSRIIKPENKPSYSILSF